MNVILNMNFKFNSNKTLFNNNYFICLYDKQDNYITSFDNLEDISKFLKKPVWRILENLRRGIGITYDHKYCKLVCLEKNDEEDL